MAEKRERLSPENVAKISEGIFAMPVTKVTAPGGKTRESLRIHFPGRTIVATQRKYAGRMRLEAEVLRRLTEQGAPVPKFLGGNEQIFFQEDVGSRRLSGELVMQEGAAQLDVAARAIESLVQIRAAGEASNLAEIVPELGFKRDWIAGFVGTAIKSSEKYKIDRPKIDLPSLVERLEVSNKRFIKWDARSGNASIGADGKVYWFDWEHCGSRQGVEDFAWLAGDEFWPVASDEIVDILVRLLPKDQAGDEIDYLAHFITFHIVQRLTIIHRRFVKAGWVDAAKALKYDKVGVDPDLGKRLCRHGAGWADRAALTRPMVRWFEDCAEAMDSLVFKPKKTKTVRAKKAG